jgi:hypothetical protein
MENKVDKTQIIGKRPGPTMVPLWKVFVAMFVLAFLLSLMFLAFLKFERRSDFDAGFKSGKGQAETQGLPGAPGRGRP